MVSFNFTDKLKFWNKITIYDLIDKNNNFTENTIYKNFNSYNSENFNEECLDNDVKSKNDFRIYNNVCKKYDKEMLDEMNLTFDYIQVGSGFLGREYMKTSSIYYFNKNYDKDVLLEIQTGSGYVLLESVENIVKIKIVNVKKGSKVIVPSGFAFVMINKSNELLSALVLRSQDSVIERNVFQKIGGMTLFYVKKNGFVRNENVTPFYHLEEHVNNYLEGFNLGNSGIYEELMKLPEKFKFLK